MNKDLEQVIDRINELEEFIVDFANKASHLLPHTVPDDGQCCQAPRNAFI